MNSVPCVVRSGGHSNAGYSTIDGSKDNGFMISMAKMKNVNVVGNTAVVQTGAQWREVYNQMDSETLIVGGECPTVGVGGYTLGGGFGALSRIYGLAIDNVISMTMVTVDGGRVVVANAFTNTDLFWALRGGGGGNFGIVTDVTFKIHKVAYSNYMYMTLTFDVGEKSRKAMATLGKIKSQFPTELYMVFKVTPARVFNTTILYYGSYMDALEYLKPVTDLANAMEVTNYDTYYDLLARFSLNSPYIGYGNPGCLVKNMDEETFDEFTELLFSLNIPLECEIHFDQIGGAIAEVPSDETAYYYRDAEFELLVTFDYDGEHMANELQFEKDLFSILDERGYCIGYYVNNMDRKLDNWQEKFYGSNYQRLLEIKNKWNPVGIGHFHFQQEIGSDHHC